MPVFGNGLTGMELATLPVFGNGLTGMELATLPVFGNGLTGIELAMQLVEATKATARKKPENLNEVENIYLHSLGMK